MDHYQAFIVDSYLQGIEFISTGEHAGFSWHACECCGSTLGGDRYAWSGILLAASSYTGADERIEGTCCVDCVRYLNGETPAGEA